MQVPRCPATVRGDENRTCHWLGREGVVSRTIPEPGDLPCRLLLSAFRGGGLSASRRCRCAPVFSVKARGFMRNACLFLAGVIWVLCRASLLVAQETQTLETPSPGSVRGTPAPTPVSQLEPVVVTATRVETPLKEVAPAVTVVTQEDMQQQQAKTVAEALRNVPGLEVEQQGSRGTTTSVFIRGAEPDQTLVLIDGVKVNSVTLGYFDFANLTTENVDRIEVLRGGGGTLYGSEAVGGVIPVIKGTKSVGIDIRSRT